MEQDEVEKLIKPAIEKFDLEDGRHDKPTGAYAVYCDKIIKTDKFRAESMRKVPAKLSNGNVISLLSPNGVVQPRRRQSTSAP